MNRTFKVLSRVLFLVLGGYFTSSIIAGIVMDGHDYFASAWRFSNWPAWLQVLLIVFCIVSNIPSLISLYRSVYTNDRIHDHDITKG